MSENLPPLPLPDGRILKPSRKGGQNVFSEAKMRAYARTACAAERDARIAELKERIRMALESIDENDPTGAAQVLRPALKKEAP